MFVIAAILVIVIGNIAYINIITSMYLLK